MKMATIRNWAIALLVLIAAFYAWGQHLDNREASVSGSGELQPVGADSLPVLGNATVSSTEPLKSGPQAGMLAPAFSLQGGEGQNYEVGGPRDKAVLLNFWASWCDPCKAEAPELNKIADKYKDRLDIYGINVTRYDYKGNAERFVDKYALVFPVMYDLKGDVYARYNGTVFPTNVLIGRDGVVLDVILGGITADEMEAKLTKLIQANRL